MDAKLPMDIFENVMQLAIEGCKAIANYIREVRKSQLDLLVVKHNIGLASILKFNLATLHSSMLIHINIIAWFSFFEKVGISFVGVVGRYY